MNKLKELIAKNKNDIIIPVAVLLVICIVIPLALSVTNLVTVKKIAELEEKSITENMSKLIKADTFEKKELPLDEGDIEYYVAKTAENITGYVFVTYSKGYGGDVSVMTAVNADGSVNNVSILDISNETPGLGQNASKKTFYSQFNGKKSGISLVKSGADSSNNEIDTVTGATITSKAVTTAVNMALDNYSVLMALENHSFDIGDGANQTISTTEGEVQ